MKIITMDTLIRRLTIVTGLIFLTVICLFAQPNPVKKDSVKPLNLVFPSMLEKEKRLAGNPLATYAAIINLEQQYRASPFSPIYDEIRYSFEEFLGFPEAGKNAMSLPQFKARSKTVEDADLSTWSALPIIDVIKEEAKKTKIIIWGEEHHLPQTRAPFEEILMELKKLGYSYLAAETFADGLSDSTLKYADYNTGFYTQDPIFASAVNSAIQMGFKLIDYDTKETSPTEPSLRDIRQAENIVNKIFKKDPNAKVFIIAGRGHASEITSGGWKPMAYNLKQLTGIDPFTMMTQTMTERLSREEEDPYYKKATELNLVNGVSIMKKKGGVQYLGSDAFDAYVFFPRTEIINGRPNWMFSLGRKPVPLPFKNLDLGKGIFLVQAFLEDQPFNTVPVDQVVISNTDKNKTLALKDGKYRVRIVDPNSQVLDVANVKVK